MKKVCLVVPSIRQESFKRFIDEWRPTGIFERVDCVLIEDNPSKTFPTPSEVKHHFSWEDIDRHEWSWIIPRRSDTVRSFGYWWAWSQGYEYLQTADDDCYPAEGYEELDVIHRQMLEGRSRWFNTLNSVTPRGVPYKNHGQMPVHVNHGIWQGVLDYDAPHQLVDPRIETYTHDNRIVPHGAFFPFCGMNVMWRREAIPLSYHLLMGKQTDYELDGRSLAALQFDRFGDIWCGIIQKKVCDHLGWSISTGTPYIHHDRASDPFKNLRKEANGIEVNETFWEVVDSTRLRGNDVLDCYKQVADSIRVIGGEHAEYWLMLSGAMTIWANLFKGG